MAKKQGEMTNASYKYWISDAPLIFGRSWEQAQIIVRPKHVDISLKSKLKKRVQNEYIRQFKRNNRLKKIILTTILSIPILIITGMFGLVVGPLAGILGGVALIALYMRMELKYDFRELQKNDHDNIDRIYTKRLYDKYKIKK